MSYTPPVVTVAYLGSLFSEFANANAAQVAALNTAGAVYVSQAFGKNAQYALALVIAHILKLGDNKGAGPATMNKVGDNTTTRAALSTTNVWKMTSYGMLYLSLARSMGMGVPQFINANSQGSMEAFGGYATPWPSDSNPQA